MEKIKEVDIVDIITKDQIKYTFSNINRNIPSVIDGLKPTQRKIIYTMYKNKLFEFTKSTKVIGLVAPLIDTGNQGTYQSLVYLSQKDRYRFPYIISQGNFGNIIYGIEDYADMRYTDVKLSDFAIDFLFPEDSLLDESSNLNIESLNSILPMGLVMGSYGISYTTSNSVPPHALYSVARSYINYMKGIEDDYSDVYVEFPNDSFCMGGYEDKIRRGQYVGKSKFMIIGKFSIDGNKIIIRSLPYLVSVVNFIDSIYKSDYYYEYIDDVNDLSGKDGIRIEITINKNTSIASAIDFICYNTSFTKQIEYKMNYTYRYSNKLYNRFSIFKRHLKNRINNINKYFNNKLDDINKEIEILKRYFKYNYLFDLIKIDGIYKILKHISYKTCDSAIKKYYDRLLEDKKRVEDILDNPYKYIEEDILYKIGKYM